MNKDIYLMNLRKNLINNDSEEDYIKVCEQYAKQLLLRELPVIFDIKHCDLILKMREIKEGKQAYKTFFIYGKRKVRMIISPSLKLKARQEWIMRNILEKVEVHSCCHGFVKNHSILTNAKMHCNQSNLLTLDIESFFESITQKQVIDVFTSLGYTTPVSKRLSDICCYNGYLPQGAPTSPYLSNLVFKQLDMELSSLAKRHTIVYTRYADDLFFSGKDNVFAIEEEIKTKLEKYGFKINTKKTRRYADGKDKIITGLIIIDGKIRVPKYFRRKIKQEIYYCKEFGPTLHLENSCSKKIINFKEYLYGKAYYIKMIEPDLGEDILKQLDLIAWD